jgi:hypothetical protein
VEQFILENQVKQLKTLVTVIRLISEGTLKYTERLRNSSQNSSSSSLHKLKFLKLLKKLFIIWLDIFQFLDENLDPEVAPQRKGVSSSSKPEVAIKELGCLFNVLPPDMFRDLIESVSDKLYDSLVKAKTVGPEQACVRFIDFYMKNSSDDPTKPKEEHVSIMLETFFEYLINHI